MDISIVILNYKSKGFTLNCIKSIKESDFGDLRHEIIVVDNNSDDALGDILKWQYGDIKFIQNEVNLGMGAGNNVGIRRAQGDYIVVMNPDTLVLENTFTRFYEYMEDNPAVGIVGPKQLNPDKTIQDSCFRWHGLFTPLYRRTFVGRLRFAQKDLFRFLMRDYDHEMEKDVDWLLGSFLFCRSKALDQVGLFDERFFMYFEDTDLCRRFWRKDLRVVYNPDVEIIHNHVRLSAQSRWFKALWNRAARHHIKSWLKYLSKWRGKN